MVLDRQECVASVTRLATVVRVTARITVDPGLASSVCTDRVQKANISSFCLCVHASGSVCV